MPQKMSAYQRFVLSVRCPVCKRDSAESLTIAGLEGSDALGFTGSAPKYKPGSQPAQAHRRE